MLQIIGYIFLIAIVIVLIKFGYALIMRCCAMGVIAFICVGMVVGVLALFGKISSDTAWTVSKWAFYIGTAINILEVLSHPIDAISDAWDFTTDTDYSGGSSESDRDETYYSDGNNSSSSTSGDSETDVYAGLRCCGNCRWNMSTHCNNVVCTHNPAGANNGVYDRCSDYLKG